MDLKTRIFQDKIPYIHTLESNIISDFLQSFCTDSECKTICFTGAGGKSTLLYAFAYAGLKLGLKVLITTSTKMYHPAREMGVFCEANYKAKICLVNAIEQLWEEKNCIYMMGEPVLHHPNKITAPKNSSILEMKQAADLLLVEADGARGMPLKVPGKSEPVIVDGTDCVIGVVGLSAIGGLWKDVCFRGEMIPGKVDVASLTNHIIRRNGLAKGVEGKHYICVLSQSVGLMDKVKEIVLFLNQMITDEQLENCQIPQQIWSMDFLNK